MKKTFLSVVSLLCLFGSSLSVSGENTQLDYVLTYDGGVLLLKKLPMFMTICRE